MDTSRSACGVWQRPKQHRSDDREDGGVGADAERQRQEGGDREGPVLPEEPEREDEILPQSVHSWPPRSRGPAYRTGV